MHRKGGSRDGDHRKGGSRDGDRRKGGSREEDHRKGGSREGNCSLLQFGRNLFHSDNFFERTI